MRYRLDIAYHGQGFHGWQRQPGHRTVQGELELWLTRLLRSSSPITLVGAGRTDAGVHAAGMVAHLDIDAPFDHAALLRRLQVALPPDLNVMSIAPVPADFHARYSAIGRVYTYRIAIARTPFGRDRHWYVGTMLDYSRLESAAVLVLGEHDFCGFCRAASRRRRNRCHVLGSHWTDSADVWIYRIQADRFLHEMVRLLVGTMVDVARGRFPIERITELLDTGDVRLCGEAAPPHGLTLEQVLYPSYTQSISVESVADS